MILCFKKPVCSIRIKTRFYRGGGRPAPDHDNIKSLVRPKELFLPKADLKAPLVV